MLVAGLNVTVFGQDAHYWTSQFGTRSTLLGGVVIGSVDDMGATYYNPGRLALIENPSFLISARVYDYSVLLLRDGAEDGTDLKSNSFNPAPGLIAGSFKPKQLSGHHFAYSVLPRIKVNYELSVRQVTDVGGLGANPGIQQVKQEIALQQKIDESWWGLTWSYRIHPRVGIGITPYLAFRKEHQSERVLAGAEISEFLVATAIYINEFSYSTYRALAKTGASYEDSTLSLGVTVTLPSLHVFGEGSTVFSLTQSGGDLNGDGTIDDRLTTSNQEDIDAQYRSTWAVGGGIAYRFRHVRVHTSAEWYAGVSAYEVIEVDSTLRSLTLSISHYSQPVFNYGVGAEFTLIRKTRGYVSFATDRSAVPASSDANNISLTTWNFYHFTGGASLAIGQSELVLGLSYSQGKQILPTIFDLQDELGVDLIKTADTIHARVQRWKFIFGVSIDL